MHSDRSRERATESRKEMERNCTTRPLVISKEDNETFFAVVTKRRCYIMNDKLFLPKRKINAFSFTLIANKHKFSRVRNCYFLPPKEYKIHYIRDMEETKETPSCTLMSSTF